MKNIRGWSNYIIGVCLIKLRQKSFVLETVSYMANACVRELLRTRGMGQGCDHSCRNMHILLNVYGCVNMALYVHLGGE